VFFDGVTSLGYCVHPILLGLARLAFHQLQILHDYHSNLSPATIRRALALKKLRNAQALISSNNLLRV